MKKVAQEKLNRKLKWFLVVISLLAGILWILAAFDIVGGKEAINLLYLAAGVVSLMASGAWLLSLRAS